MYRWMTRTRSRSWVELECRLKQVTSRVLSIELGCSPKETKRILRRPRVYYSTARAGRLRVGLSLGALWLGAVLPRAEEGGPPSSAQLCPGMIMIEALAASSSSSGRLLDLSGTGARARGPPPAAAGPGGRLRLNRDSDLAAHWQAGRPRMAASSLENSGHFEGDTCR